MPAEAASSEQVARPPVIIAGGSTNALCIARSLTHLGVSVHGLGGEPFVAASKFVTALPFASGDRATALAEALLGPATEHLRGAVVLACDDAAITVLAAHREALLERFLLDASNTDAQLAMLDKLSTYEAARAAGVPTPKFWRVDTGADIERYRDELVYPLIVKPLLSHEYQARFPGATKFRTAHDLESLRAAYRDLDEAGLAVMLVERIPGDDTMLCSYTTYVDADGGPTFDYTKRVVRRYPPGMGLACAHVTDWIPEVKDVTMQLVKHVGLRGLACVEFIRDARDGQLKLIECNARFSAAVPLTVAAGMDLPRHVYCQVIGEEHRMPATFRTGLRMVSPVDDLRAFLVLRREGRLSLGGWLSSLAHRQVFPVLRLDDPAPAFVRAAFRLRKGAARVRARR